MLSPYYAIRAFCLLGVSEVIEPSPLPPSSECSFCTPQPNLLFRNLLCTTRPSQPGASHIKTAAALTKDRHLK
ncbi:hypothetical protein VULLAG_LOCUS857 [Vulpes lagopus]